MTRVLRVLMAFGMLLQLFSSAAFAMSADDDDTVLANAPRLRLATGTEGPVPGTVLVKLTESAQAGGDWLDAFAARGFLAGEEVRQVADAVGIRRLTVAPGTEEAAAAALATDPRVEWAEPDYRLRLLLAPNDRYYAKWQWYMRQIGAEAAWDVTTGSTDITVAVIDSGVDPSHPEFQGRFVAGYNFVGDNTDTHDTVGHGTAVAGLIGAQGNNGMGVAGLAWKTKIMPLRVGDEEGAKSSDAARAVKWAADHGARVINLSLGTAREPKVLEDAIAYAYKKGAVIVAAMGNEYDSGNPVEYPAASPYAIAVGATNSDGKRASYSNTGSHVKFVAPGGDAKGTKDTNPNSWVFSTFFDPDKKESTYAGGVGTSLATPQVAGLAAMILAVNPSLTNTEVEQIMVDTADRIGGPERSIEYGYGRINVGRAVKAAMPKRVQLGLDSPTPGATVSGLVNVAGWAADVANPTGAGIESVAVYLNAPPPAGTLLGQAQFGTARQDVATRLNASSALNSGFTYNLDSTALPDGAALLYLIVQPTAGPASTLEVGVTIQNRRDPQVGPPVAAAPAGLQPPTGTAAPAVPVPAPAPMPSVQPDPAAPAALTAAPIVADSTRTNLDSVQPGQAIKGPILVSGWAADPTATGNANIVGVQVLVDGPLGQGTPVQPVVYGLPRPDVAAYLGNPSLANCGFQVGWDPTALPPGDHQLYIYPMRANGTAAAPLMVPVTVGG